MRDNNIANANWPIETKEGYCSFRLIFRRSDRSKKKLVKNVFRLKKIDQIFFDQKKKLTEKKIWPNICQFCFNNAFNSHLHVIIRKLTGKSATLEKSTSVIQIDLAIDRSIFHNLGRFFPEVTSFPVNFRIEYCEKVVQMKKKQSKWSIFS